MNQNKGITLVVLIVTIIVMLILAGVAISLVFNGSLFEQTKKVSEETKRAIVQEGLALELAEFKTYTDKTYVNPKSLDGENLLISKLQILDEDGNIYWLVNSDEFGVNSKYSENDAEGKVKTESLKEVYMTDENLSVYYINSQGEVYPELKAKQPIKATKPDNTWIPIYNAEQLSKIASGDTLTINGENYVMTSRAKYILMKSINLLGYDPEGNGKGFKPIQTSEGYFDGTFDGNGLIISNLTIDRGDEDNIGLFAKIDRPGINISFYISNLELKDVNIKGNNNVGGLSGQAVRVTWENIKVSGSIKGNDNVGGIMGGGTAYTNSIIINTHNSARVEGRNCVGGLIGLQGPSHTVRGSSNIGDVLGTSDVGGFFGRSTWNDNKTVNNSYNAGNITGISAVGGIVGRLVSASIDVTNSYNSGKVTGLDSGGICGVGVQISLTNSYWCTDTSTKGATPDGAGRTMQQMLEKSTYEGWDFDTIWTIVGENLPKLK